MRAELSKVGEEEDRSYGDGVRGSSLARCQSLRLNTHTTLSLSVFADVATPPMLAAETCLLFYYKKSCHPKTFLVILQQWLLTS